MRVIAHFGLAMFVVVACQMDEGKKVPVISPEGLKVTAKGRVLLESATTSGSSIFTAPEYNVPDSDSNDNQLEKMLIYSMGATVLEAAVDKLSPALTNLLRMMTNPSPVLRATLMDVLDGVAEHCVERGQAKPFSHLLMNLYSEVTDQEERNCKQFENAQDKDEQSAEIVVSQRDEKKRCPVKRAASRLYRADVSKYHCPATCIGPEFIIRASDPPRVIHVGDIKPALRRKLVVILLNGQKLEITCDPASTTVGNVFEVIVESESIEENFLLGLAMMVSGDFVFLAPETRLYKIAPTGWSSENRKQPYYSFTLYLRVLFYLPSLRGIRLWSMKHVLYFQLRRTLLEHQIRCSVDEIKTFAGLALQAEFGDYIPKEHGCGDYFLMEHYMSEHYVANAGVPEKEIISQLQDLHKARRGLDPGRAEELFVGQAMQLGEYGTHFYSALSVASSKEATNLEVWLGISGKGILVCPKHCCGSNSPRLSTLPYSQMFLWNDIKKLCYSKQYFELIPQGKSSKLKFKMDSNKSFSVFRLASLHHKFFLKLRNEMSSLQALVSEFGIPVRKKEKDTSKTVYYIGSNANRTNDSLLKRSASFFSPERVIFRGKTASHCRSSGKLSSESFKGETSKSSKFHAERIKDDECVWEVSPLAKCEDSESAPSSLYMDNTQESYGRRARGPRMGTRAFLGMSQMEMLDSPPHSPLPQAYVLNSSIKSIDDRYHIDFQETISDSLAEKFNKIPFVDERILTTVRMSRDATGSFGIQVSEGSDGGVYIQSIVPGSKADSLGVICKGDQVQAVNGQNILNLHYVDALSILKEVGSSMELVLSQENCGQKIVQHSNMYDYTPGETSGTDLIAALVQKPIEESYFRVIRYETATELEEKMINRTLPRSASKDNSDNIRANEIVCTVPVPVPRTKKKLKMKTDCFSKSENNEIQLNKVVPPKRTKKKHNDDNDDACNTNINLEISGDVIKMVEEEPFLNNVINVCVTEYANDNELFNNVVKEIDEDKIISPVKNDKGPKIVKLIEKNSLEFNNNITVNSNKADINYVPKFKMNFCKKPVVGCAKKDSEDDSGVYFSDSTKVSPTKVKSDDEVTRNIINNKNDTRFVSVDAFCNTPQPNNNYIITSDSVDNKKETNLGPLNTLDSSITVNPLLSVLDGFEAEMVNTFKQNMFGTCRNKFTEENEKPAIGERLNQYLQGILNGSDDYNQTKFENFEFVDNDDVDEGAEKLKENEGMVGSKVYKETVSETCNNILPCVSSYSQDELDSNVNIDYPSTNLGFVVKCSSTTDFFNTINNDVNNLIVNSNNDSESSNQESYLSYSESNSPIYGNTNNNNNNNEYCLHNNLVFNRPSEHNITLNESLTNSLINENNNSNSLEMTDSNKDKDSIENEINETKNEVVVNNYKNKVKSLINYFESIVKNTNVVSDSNPSDDFILSDSDIHFDDLSSIDINVCDEFIGSTNELMKKVTKSVTFNDDLIIINDDTTEDFTSVSSVSYQEIFDEPINEISYDKIIINNSDLNESVQVSTAEDNCDELQPLIDEPPDMWNHSDKEEVFQHSKQLVSSTDFQDLDLFISESVTPDVENFERFDDSKFTQSPEYNEALSCGEFVSSCVSDQLLCDAKLDNHLLDSDNQILSADETSLTFFENKEESEVQLTTDNCIIKPVDGEDNANQEKCGDNEEENYNFDGKLFEVVLEKLWGSIGIKLAENKETSELCISDLLPGGAAEASKLIIIGTLNYE